MGNLQSTVFLQLRNLQAHEDGLAFWKKLMDFTSIASLQLSNLASCQILEFDPEMHKFNVPAINTKLMHLFILVMTLHHALTEGECIQHLHSTYANIKQPEQWAQWVCIQEDKFKDGALTVSQGFMNLVSVKYNKIASSDTGFHGSSKLSLRMSLLCNLMMNKIYIV